MSIRSIFDESIAQNALEIGSMRVLHLGKRHVSFRWKNAELGRSSEIERLKRWL